MQGCWEHVQWWCIGGGRPLGCRDVGCGIGGMWETERWEEIMHGLFTVYGMVGYNSVLQSAFTNFLLIPQKE